MAALAVRSQKTPWPESAELYGDFQPHPPFCPRQRRTRRHLQLHAIDRRKDGQECNHRKQRKGAYWEDRYHATAVETDRHLIQCMVYMDMNMVRAGVVKHPSVWPFSGYSEIQAPRERYAILDYEGLRELLNFRSMDDLANAYRRLIDDAVLAGDRRREGKWTESIAVGSASYVNATKEKLGIKARSRDVIESDGSYVLRESRMPYKAILWQENECVRPQNDYYWNDPVGLSAT